MWLIGLTDAADSRLLEWANSFSVPPALEANGARPEAECFAPERRAIRLVADEPVVSLTFRPAVICVNPVLEFRNALPRLAHVSLNGSPLPAEDWAWDGQTCWMNITLRELATLRLEFSK